MHLLRFIFLATWFVMFPLQGINGQAIENHSLQLHVQQDLSKVFSCKNIFLQPQDSWNKLSSPLIRLGFSKTPYWVRVKLQDFEALTSNRFIIFQHDLLESVERCGNGKVVERAGIKFAFTQWPLQTRFPSFKIRAQETSKYTYFKMQSSTVFNFPLKIYALSEYIVFLQNRQILQYILIAISLLVGLFYFLYYLSGKETLYLYFSLLMWSFGMSFYIAYGDAYMHFWPNSPDLGMGIKVSSSLSGIIATLFGRHLLNSWTVPKLDRLFQAMIAMMAFHLVISFVPEFHSLYMFILLISPFCAMAIIISISIIQYRRKQYFVTFYLLGWMIILFSLLLNVLVSVDLQPYSFYLYYAPLLATPFGMICFMIGSYRRAVAQHAEMKRLQKKFNIMVAKFDYSEPIEYLPSSQLVGVDVNKSIQLLGKLIQKEKLYELEDLRLENLAQHMNLRSHQLSELLNKELQVSFAEFIQQFRVDAAKKQLANPKNENTILNIGLSVGFGSKTAFNRSFVRMTGMPPSQYRKSMKTVA